MSLKMLTLHVSATPAARVVRAVAGLAVSTTRAVAGLAIALSSLSCSERELVVIAAADVSLVSCNGNSDPASLALYVDFLVENSSDESVSVLGIELKTEGDGLSRVAGSQTFSSAVTVDAGATKAFTCKNGFTVSYPGENTFTDIRMDVTYRQGDAQVTMIRYLQMDATTAWDNCGAFLGNDRACAAK